MTDDMIKEHLARAHLAESVTLDAGTWTEVLEEVLRLRQVSYDLLGELTAHRAAQSLRQASEDLRARTTGNRPLTKEQMRAWIEETWQRCQDEAWAEGQAITIGNFTLSRYDEASYWLAHASGEGMQVKQDRLQRLIDELWQEF